MLAVPQRVLPAAEGVQLASGGKSHRVWGLFGEEQVGNQPRKLDI